MKSVFFLLLNTLSASIITLVIALSLRIGTGFKIDTSAYEAHEVPEFTDTIVSLFPSNLADSWIRNSVVPIIIFALFIAIAYNRLVQKKKDVQIFKTFVDATNKVLGEAISWIMKFTPYAVVSLIARAVGRSTVTDLLPLAGVLAVAYAALIIQLFGVESLFIAAIGHLNPLRFLKGIRSALIVAFTSQSSVGTLPVTQRALTEKLGVKEDVATFTSGLGANLGMPGCAGMWPTLLAVFTINALGLDYGPAQYAGIVLLTLAVSIGTVGVPGTATITATALFAAAGLPIEMIVMLAPISSIVDMGRTATNVAGAAEAALLVAKTEKLLDEEVHNGKNEEAEHAEDGYAAF